MMMIALIVKIEVIYICYLVAFTLIFMYLVCPKACKEVIKECVNNTYCAKIRETFYKECENVLRWDGNSTKPNCTDECKELGRNAEKYPIIKHIKCCIDDGMMNVALRKRNMEILCGTKLESSEECQNKRKACEHIRAKEDNLDHPGMHRT